MGRGRFFRLCELRAQGMRYEVREMRKDFPLIPHPPSLIPLNPAKINLHKSSQTRLLLLGIYGIMCSVPSGKREYPKGDENLKKGNEDEQNQGDD